MSSYIVENGIIGLRETKVEDLDYVLLTETYPENKQYVGQWEYAKHNLALKDGDILHIIIEDCTNHKSVGYAILAGIKNQNKALELRRIVISEKGNGYGKSTLSLLKELAFEKFDFNRLWLDVRLKNERAQSVYKLTGFVEEGILREAVLYDGRFESLVVLSILKSDYLIAK
jgi:diamine N-acetyltransferase